MVRVTLQSPQKNAALVSLMVAGIAAASVWAGYWVWHQDQTTQAVQRGLPDVIVRWKCPRNHVFEARGSYEALPCPTCSQPSRILVTYQCVKDGGVDALVMYDAATRRLSAVKFAGGPWVTITTLVPCPTCGGELRPKLRGPFDRMESPTGALPKVASQPST